MDLIIGGGEQNALVNQTHEAMSKDPAKSDVDKNILKIYDALIRRGRHRIEVEGK